MTNRRILDFGARYWRVVKDISFLLCILIVILLIFMHDTVINSKIGSNQEAPEDTEVTGGEIFVSYLNNVLCPSLTLDHHNHSAHSQSDDHLLLLHRAVPNLHHLPQGRDERQEDLNLEKRVRFQHIKHRHDLLHDNWLLGAQLRRETGLKQHDSEGHPRGLP